MKKLLIAMLFFVFALPVLAQTTSVSGNIADSTAQSFNYGTWEAHLIGPQGYTGPFFYNGTQLGPTDTQKSGLLDSSGNISVTVYSNNVVFVSGSSQALTLWQFTVCSAAYPSPCYTTALNITGSTFSVTGTIVPPPIQVSATATGPWVAYSDSEITGARVGFTYWNIASSASRVCNAPACTWVTAGGGATPASPGASVQFSNASSTALATVSVGGIPLGVDSLSAPTVLNVPLSVSASGPNPSIDVQSPVYGGRPTNGQVQTTCTTVGGTGAVSCASLANFKQGDGVVIYAGGNAPTITTPAAPTVTSPWVTGSVTHNYQCLPLDAADGFPAATSAGTVTTAPTVFGNGPVAISNVSWTGSVVTLTFSSTFDANFASYSANTKSVSVVGMGTGLTALNGYWMIASEPSATSLTFSLATSGSGTFTGAMGRATNTVPGVSVSRSGSTMTVTMAFAEPINVNSYLAPTTVILAGWLPADINGRYAISSNFGDTVSGAVITLHSTPMNETESSTQAGTVTVYEGIKVACPNITTGTVQYEVYGDSNPGGTMQPIGKTLYGQRTFMDYGYWMRNGSSGFYVPPYIPTSPPVAAQNDMYVGKIISITGNSMTVSPNVPSTVTNATTFHDDTTAILAAAAVISGAGSVALTPPNSASCAGCGYHTKFPLILPSKVDLELEAPLDSDETIVGSSATNAANGIWKGPNAVGQTTCGQFAQKKCEPLYGHANPIVVFPGGQNFLNGLVLSTNQNGTSNSDDGQVLAQFGAGTGAQGAESMSDDYLTTNAATTSTPLVVIGQVSPFQIRDSNFSSSWPNGGPASPGMVNLLPNLGAIWARAGDNSTDNGIMPGDFNFTGNVYFNGKGFLLDGQNYSAGTIDIYNLTALNDDQQPVTPYFMDYGGGLPAENVNIANVTMDSNTVSLVAQMTSGGGGGNWWLANDSTSGGAPAVTGQVIPALTVRDVTPLLGQNYQYSNNTNGTYDFSGVKLMNLRVSAGLTTTVNGDFGYDSTNGNWHGWNGADSIFAPLASGFVSGDCGQPTSSGGKWTIADAGAACGVGSGANTALSNLAAVAINTSLLPASSASASLGSTSLPFGSVFFKTSLDFTETSAPSGAAGHDVCYGDSAVHSIECNLNNVGFHVLAMTGLDLSGTGGGGTTVSGLKGNVLPSLTTGFLNWTGSAWALSSAGSGNTTSTSLTNNVLPKANGANSIINSSLTDNGTTVITTEPFNASNLSAGTAPSSAGATATGGIAFTEAANTGWTPTASQEYQRADSTLHSFVCSLNGGAETACDPLIAGDLGGTSASPTVTNVSHVTTGILPVANGGNGTATPGIVAGTNVTVSGSWPTQTINSTGGGTSTAATVANDTTTGTIVNELAQWNAGSTGAIVPTAAVQGSTGNAFIGVVTAGAGTTGNATIVTAGYAQCLSDNAATLGHWAVQGSTGVFGKCHDSGTAFTGTPPAYAIGVFTTTGAAGLQGIILRADASSFLGTLRIYGVQADGPGVYNTALSYDNNNSNYTAGWQIGGNTTYGAITGGPAGTTNTMLRGQITITNPATTGIFTFPTSGSGQAYTSAPVCVVAADTTSAIFAVTGAPWVDSAGTTAAQLQVDVAVTPAATIKVNYVCVGFPN